MISASLAGVTGSTELTVQPAPSSIHYVSLSGAHVSPFSTWATAATNIQAAVDVAMDGDTVLVSNGIYATGGRVVYGAMSNRVVITKPVTVRSVNGPAMTIIQGAEPVGDTAVRCAYVGSNAVLVGFTLTDGATRSSGDDLDCRGGGVLCESSGVLSNCVLTGNSASDGGGTSGGVLYNCILTGNSASRYGGGTYNGTLYNCTLTGNSAAFGGGAEDSALYNCTLTDNSTSYSGGGAAGGTLYNCTLTGNSAYYDGGGVLYGTLYNCIVYYNEARRRGANFYGSTFKYSCTTPSPGGSDNITNDPQLASFSHIAVGSPCRGAGHSTYATGTDIDGEAWRAPPSMGCDEVVAGASTGALSVSAWAASTSVAVSFPIRFRADIVGRATGSVWDFGDGTVLSNKPYAVHAYASPGVYAVLLRAYNESYPQGITATVMVQVAVQTIHYVKLGNATPIAPYTSWATAATNIQDAIDAADQVGALVLVGNGIYATGGRVVYGVLRNRVVITKPVTVRSVKGPAMTIIQGAGPVGDDAVRCAYVGINAVLEGFTLANGATRSSGDYYGEQCGGGAWCESSGVLSNCVLTGNSAFVEGGGTYYGTLYNCILSGNLTSGDGGGTYGGTLYNCTLTGNSASRGGGAYDGKFYNCTLTGNSAYDLGGGVSYSTLYNCTLTGNSAYHLGGGASDCALYNCIVYYNSAANGANYASCTFNYSCTTPYPGGSGNITSEPQLASFSHLALGSPCRGAGHSDYTTGTDMDGEVWRIPPSMGCDEVVAGAITGALSVHASAAPTNVAAGFPIRFQADILGPTTRSEWDFGDGTVLSNKPHAMHTYTSAGMYTVLLRAYNESYPQGITATVMVQVAVQTIHYVKLGNTTPIAPYTSWATAATNIQDALDAANQIGALVLVSNGIYATGGRVVYGAMSNRVVITKPVTVRSVNGPAMTIIQGAGPIGDSAVRCAYVGSNAVLEGFMLTQGATRTRTPSIGIFDPEQTGGGAWCESSGVLSNCILTGNSADGSGGGAYYGTLYNCSLTDNSASYGGGACYGTLYNCTLTGNSASSGGGAYNSTLDNCTLTGNLASLYGGGTSGSMLDNCTLAGNSASHSGGGVDGGTLYNCTLTGNSASDYGGGAAWGATFYNCTLTDNSAGGGGGTYDGTLYNCTLTGNSAFDGGGAYYGTLYNCMLASNSATYSGGACWGATLYNCTLTGNSAKYAGGAWYGMLYNCIVYYNTAPSGPNYLGSTLNYSCTTPDPGGIGNITNDPRFVSAAAGDYHLQATSPCINAGTNQDWMIGATDLAGNPRINASGRVDMGAYEYQEINIWPDTTAPILADAGPDSPVELGAKFKSDVAGAITGIRFYKAAANTGTHVGNLWTSNGTLLAAVTFSNETASGWQQALFATPVAIASNTVYVASYHANNGHYSADLNYFSVKGVDNPPLHVLMNGVFGGNGVYAYGASSLFPNQSYNAANYWVDVIFQPGYSSSPTPLTPMTLIAAGDSSCEATASAASGSAERRPSVWTSGDFSEECGAANLIDGNTNTIWIGNVGGEPWRMILDFGAVTDVTGIQLMFQDSAWTNKEIIGSRDSEVWFDYLAATNEWVSLRYLYVDFWRDEHGAQPPAIREIIWRER